MNIKTIPTLIGLLSAMTLTALAENLIPGDTSAETETDTLTLGNYSSGLVPFFWDDTTAFDGKRSIRVDWDHEKRRKSKESCWVDHWISTATSSELKEGETYTISFYAKASVNNFPLVLQMHPGAGWDYSGAVGLYSNDFNLSKEWKRYSFSFIPKMQAAAPIKGYMTIFGFNKSPVGSVWLDAVQLEKGEVPTPYQNSSAMNAGVSMNSPHWSNIYFPDEPVVAAIRVAMQPGKADLQCRVIDYQGRVIKESTQQVSGSCEIKLPLDIPRLGWFKVTAMLAFEKKVLSSHSANYIRIQKPVNVAAGMHPYSGLINIQGYDFFDISKKLGSKRAEAYADWKNIETSPGKYDWSVVEWHLKRGRESGMLNKVIVNPFAVPEWYLDKDELAKAKKVVANDSLVLSSDQHEHWRTFVGELTRRYGDMIDELELGAEDNGRLGRNDYYMSLYPEYGKKNSVGNLFIVAGKPFDDLCAMEKIGAEEIRKTHPKMKIGAIRPSRSGNVDDLLFVREMFKKIGKDFNILPVDYYFYPLNFGPLVKDRRPKSDGLIDIYNATKKIIQELGCNQPIYMSEFGWFPDARFPDESIYRQEQAEMMANYFIVARIAGYYAFDWFLGFGGPGGCGYSSTMDQNHKIQAIAASYSAVTRVVENVTESKWLKPDSATRIAIMRKQDGKGVAAVWSDKGYTITLPAKSTIQTLFESIFGPSVAATDLMGNPILPTQGKIALSRAPIYIWHSDFNALCDLFGKANVEMSEFCEIRFRMVSESMGSLRFVNLSPTDDVQISAEITVKGITINKVIDVPKGADRTCDVPLSGKSVVVKAKTSKGTAVMEKSFALDSLTPIASGVKAQSLIASFSSRYDIMPPDPWVSWSGPDDLSGEITSSWDKSNLYLRATVKDDLHFNKFPDSLLSGDALQVAIDPTNAGAFNIPAKKGAAASPEYFEFGLALNDDGKSRCVTSHGKVVCTPNQFTITRNETDKTTVYEMRLPWADLGVTPSVGMVFGMSFIVFDDDTGSGQSYYAPIGGGIVEKNPGLYKKFVLK